MQLVLASSSPRRRELLSELSVPFTVCTADVDERIGGYPPEELVQLLSVRKARAVLPQVTEDAIVLGADTVVSLDGEILTKPSDLDEAHRMLRALSGRTHEVYTGVCLASHATSVSATACTRVTFGPMTDAEIDALIARCDPLDKAGAYAIQEGAGVYITGIDGDVYNVIGLPLFLVNRLLKSAFSTDLFSFATREERK